MSPKPLKPRPHHSTPKSKALPPIYLLRAPETCPECGVASNVHSLAAAGLYDASDRQSFNGFIVLTHVEYVPPRVLSLLADRCPGWYFDREGTGAPYLMNHCRGCGVGLSDHFVHGDAGAAFSPCSAAECWNISLFTLPVSEETPLVCSWGIGLGDLLDMGKVQPW
jgi:hypothetical protein